MQDYYSILGVGENASPDEIKKAYRKLANQHHPDKGGDQAKFKDISVAYDNLSDPQKKAEYDQQRMYGGMPGGGFPGGGFHFTTGNPFPGGNPFGDIFGNQHPFGDIFGHMRGQQVRRNRDLNISCNISLLDSYQGKQIEANYQLPSGRNQTVVINIPPGIEHGGTIRYQGLGDDSIPGVPRGNLNVTIIILNDPNFSRRGDDLYTEVSISPIEAMIGCRKRVNTITGQQMDIEIRPGVTSGTEFASGGLGFTNPHNGIKGRFISVVNIKTPAITDQDLIARLRQLNDEINQKY